MLVLPQKIPKIAQEPVVDPYDEDQDGHRQQRHVDDQTPTLPCAFPSALEYRTPTRPAVPCIGVVHHPAVVAVPGPGRRQRGPRLLRQHSLLVRGILLPKPGLLSICHHPVDDEARQADYREDPPAQIQGSVVS